MDRCLCDLHRNNHRLFYEDTFRDTPLFRRLYIVCFIRNRSCVCLRRAGLNSPGTGGVQETDVWDGGMTHGEKNCFYRIYLQHPCRPDRVSYAQCRVYFDIPDWKTLPHPRLQKNLCTGRIPCRTSRQWLRSRLNTLLLKIGS